MQTHVSLFLAAMLASGAALAASAGEQKNYRLYCMGCHQADGTGSPANGIPSMRDEVGHFLLVPGGRAYLSQVPGTLHTPLSDGETAALLTWVMRNIGGRSTPVDFQPYSADEVKSYRASVPDDISGLREKLLRELEHALSR